MSYIIRVERKGIQLQLFLYISCICHTEAKMVEVTLFCGFFVAWFYLISQTGDGDGCRPILLSEMHDIYILCIFSV